MRLSSSIVGSAMPRVLSLIGALIGLVYLSGCCAYYNLEVGDSCPTIDYRSSCQPPEQCPSLGQYIESGRLTGESVMNCGYTIRGEKICCPIE